MTEAIRQKTSARRVLAILIGLLVTILALQGIASVQPGGFEAFAQATSTPSGPRIELLNPDSTTSDEISSKNESGTGNTTYHLVAWVTEVPENALVEFQFQASGSTRADTIPCTGTTNGLAEFVSPDTFECDFDVTTAFPEAGGASSPGGDAPANGTLRAILFRNNEEVSRDEEPVAINNQDRPVGPGGTEDFRIEDQGNTVEITYPTNGGEVGFFTPTATNRAAAVIDVVASEGTQNVRVLYSESAPGTEPAFQSCGRESVTAAEQDGVRCTLASGDRPEQVTAIAAVAEDFAEDPIGAEAETTNVDAADAHRAFAYEQDPTTIFITPQTARVDANSQGQFVTCSPLMSAQVLDQETPQRRIAGVNVDVHAAGPTDALSFDDDDSSGNTTSRSQAPDQGGHSTESAVNCEATGTPGASGSQGDHERPGEGDTKHIESQAAGTDDAGNFSFRLFSPNAGTTQITAWADEDGNDVFCTEEAAGAASIGWGQDAPSPTGVGAEETTCPRPTPGQSPTSSPTGSPTATSTAEPGTDRTVTLAVDQERVVAGRQVRFSGQIRSEDSSCTDDETIEIERRVLGTTRFNDFAQTATDSQGRFSIERRLVESADYIAVVEADNECQQDSSAEETVLVKVRIQILVEDRTPNRGDRVRVKSSVRPQHDGTEMLLQRKKGRRWVTVERDTLNRRSIGHFVIKANFGRRTFRTKWRSQDAEHETNTSRRVTIRT